MSEKHLELDRLADASKAMAGEEAEEPTPDETTPTGESTEEPTADTPTGDEPTGEIDGDPPVEDPPTDEPSTEDDDLPDEPTDHGERSKMGRKIAELTNANAKTTEILQNILDKLEKPPVDEQPTEDPDSDEEFYMPTTKKEFMSLVDEVAEKKIQQTEQNKVAAQTAEVEASQKYQQGYVDHLKTLGDAKDPMHSEIYKMLTSDGSEYNVKHTDNPIVDVERNYFMARTVLLEKQLQSGEQPKPNLRQEDARPGMETPTETKHEAHEQEVKLPDDAADFVKGKGWTQEKINKTFGKKKVGA